MVLEDRPAPNYVRKELIGIELHRTAVLMRHGDWNHCEHLAVDSQITGTMWASKWDNGILREMG